MDLCTPMMVEWQHLNPGDPLQLAAIAVGHALTLAVRRRDLVFTGGLGVAAAGSVIAIRLLPILVLLAASPCRIGLATARHSAPLQALQQLYDWQLRHT